MVEDSNYYPIDYKKIEEEVEHTLSSNESHSHNYNADNWFSFNS